MTPTPQRISVPATAELPRDLTEAERSALVTIADTLCPGSNGIASPSAQPAFTHQLNVALAARADAFDAIVDSLQRIPHGDPSEWLRALHDREPDAFQALSTVVAGAYLLVPEVRTALGYPGQPRSLARDDDAVNDLEDGILDPVLDRGHFYVPTPDPTNS